MSVLPELHVRLQKKERKSYKIIRTLLIRNIFFDTTLLKNLQERRQQIEGRIKKK